MRFDRTSQSILGKWWWTVDHKAMLALLMLMCLGAILVTASSPAVATRIGVDPFHFVNRQYLFLPVAFVVMVVVSMLSVQNVRRLAVMGFLAALGLMMLLPLIGVETKGSRRWLNLVGITVQPSEFLKPCMAVVTAWIFYLRSKYIEFPGWRIAVAVYGLVVVLLLIQPDLGMVITVSAMWGVQFFLAGMPLIWVLLMVLTAPIGLLGAYNFFPHVKKRIDNFMDPSAGDNYQVEKSKEAFANGGFFGQGPGEGKVKLSLPDSHTDFVFAVAGEEFGLLFCLVILALFAFVVLRGMVNIMNEKDSFVMIAVTGLLTQFGIQAMINMGVAVNLLPAKGMTLPFISYGGSSLIAIAVGMGMMLALTRKRFGNSLTKRS